MKSENDIHIRLVSLIVVVSTITLLFTACVVQLSFNVSQAQPESAWVLLQQGGPGYVVMMRHALAPGTGDPAEFKLGDCTTQRNLSSEGREQAVKVGKEFLRRNIRIARVLSSQWCRCLDTARLMNRFCRKFFLVTKERSQSRSLKQSLRRVLR